jgi:7-alpha-hydroxysteroid dehydrogenase
MTGRVAVVTGASRGIGRGIALAFAEAGADLVLASRTQADLDLVATEAEALGVTAHAVALDATDLDALRGLADGAVERFGRIDVVVNNAGGTMPRPLLNTSSGFLERAFHFNVTTAFELTKATTPELLKHEGCVLNISSAMGRLTDRGMLAYGTAKAALAHMTRLAANELAPRVRVNAIAVGAVATDALATVTGDESLRNRMESLTPLRRIGSVEDIASAALWLCSPAGSYVTGKVIEVDGGIEAPNLPLGIPDL